MIYKTRQLEKTIKKASKTFPSILVTGPRQSGKTTLLRYCTDANFVSLEEPDTRLWATEDPRDFLESNKTPLIIDEIQYQPDLLPYIKRKIDDNRSSGRWFFTGSQQFSLMKNVSESLAGRIAITNLLPFSNSELKDSIYTSWDSWFKSVNSSKSSDKTIDLGRKLLYGTYPENVLLKNPNLKLWYGSYVRTYLERDLKTLYDVGNLNLFNKFLSLLAARTSQILNYTSLSNDVGVTVPTIQKWISILEASYIVYLLQPYHTNFGKRLIKAPKLYFLDTGLAAYLTGLYTQDALLKGPMAGALFETYVISELVKSFYNFGERPSLYYFNHKNNWEIDVLIDRNNELILWEIKLSATITPNYLKYFEKIRELSNGVFSNNILVSNQSHKSLRKNTRIINWNDL